jgi:hypothetical protein
MARIRTIKPQFWLDENLGSIKRDARLLYIGLWNLCDDRGVFEWRPAKIRVQIFPYDSDITNKTIEGLLDLLQQTKDVIKFAEKGHSFGYVPSFSEHQDIKNPSKWAYTETLPDTNTTPALPQPYPTNGEALPLGKELEVKSKELEGIGSKGGEKTPTPLKNNYGEFNNVFLTDDELKKLKERFPGGDAEKRIERLSTYLATKNVKYKSHYAVIISWAQKDGDVKNKTPPRNLPDKYTEPEDFLRSKQNA